jgi:hypothetical protein
VESACFEDLVHDLGAGGDHWPQLAAVDDLGGAGGGVAYEPGDFFGADAVVAHEADEGGSELAGRSAVAGSCRLAYPLEHFPDVGWVEGGAGLGGEDQAGIVPLVSGFCPFAGLAAG